MRNEGILTQEPFLGSTADCLKHYLGKLPWGNKGSAEARMPMADFLGITPTSIQRWAVGGTKPKGLALVKLRYYLEKQGYRITELEELQNPIRVLGKLIAVGEITCEEVLKQLKIPNNDELLRILHGNRGLSSERMVAIARICVDHPLEVQEAPGAPTGSLLSHAIALQAEARGKITDRVEEDVLHLLDSLNGLCSLLAPRLEHMLSNGFTSEQRQAFRDRAGRHRVFDMANRFYALNKQLNALCSETTREKIASANQS